MENVVNRSVASRVLVDPLMGKDVPVGSVLIIYSRLDERIFTEDLRGKLNEAGIPYFLDKDNIKPGEEWEQKLVEAYKSTACGVPIITRNSIRSPWVLYEIGYFCGQRKKIIPYVSTKLMPKRRRMTPEEEQQFMREIPPFIRLCDGNDQPDNIIEIVRRESFYIGELFDNSELNKRVIDKLIQLKLTVELDNVPESIKDKLSFGYRIVRFGRWEFPRKEPHNSEIDETKELHKILHKSERRYIADARVLRVDFVIPMHRRWGTTFKLFAEVDDLSVIEKVKQLFVNNGFEDVNGDSEKEERIYFLVPTDVIDVVCDPHDSIDERNNYIFPK